MTFEATEELQEKGTWMKESNTHINATEYPKLTFRYFGNQIDLYVDGRLLDGQQLSKTADEHFYNFEYVFKRAFDMGRASK